MKEKGFLGLLLALGAGYYWYNNKNAKNSSNNNTANSSNNSSQVKYTTYTTQKNTTVQNSSVPNVPGIDGVPFKNSPLYLGDKTKPYDAFYDYSDRLGRSYLGYVGEGIGFDRDENKYNGIRFRIRKDAFRVENTNYIDKNNGKNIDFQTYSFISPFEIFNPFRFTVNIREFRISEVKFCFRNLNHVAMSNVSISILENLTGGSVNTNVRWINSQRSQEESSKDKIGIFYGFGENYRTSFFGNELKLGSNMPILGFTLAPLAPLIDIDTFGESKIRVNSNNAMFEVSFNAKYDNYQLKYTYRPGLFYGKELKMDGEKFWEKQYTGSDVSRFIPIQREPRGMGSNLDFSGLSDFNWEALSKMNF